MKQVQKFSIEARMQKSMYLFSWLEGQRRKR